MPTALSGSGALRDVAHAPGDGRRDRLGREASRRGGVSKAGATRSSARTRLFGRELGDLDGRDAPRERRVGATTRL